MKALSSLFFLAVLLLSSFTAHSECPSKTYIDPTQVAFHEDQIWIQLGTQVIQTSALFSDEKGLYIKHRYSNDCPDGFWQCHTCGACNEKYYLWCRTCGKS